MIPLIASALYAAVAVTLWLWLVRELYLWERYENARQFVLGLLTVTIISILWLPVLIFAAVNAVRERKEK